MRMSTGLAHISLIVGEHEVQLALSEKYPLPCALSTRLPIDARKRATPGPTY